MKSKRRSKSKKISKSIKIRRYNMDKEKVKQMLCTAIDNIPEYAEIKDCYEEHSFGDCKAYLHVVIEVTKKTDDNLNKFHKIAHNSFNTDMDSMS